MGMHGLGNDRVRKSPVKRQKKMDGLTSFAPLSHPRQGLTKKDFSARQPFLIRAFGG
jgi:hypothetical protein